MRLSVRARMILAMNLLVAAVGIAVGYAGVEVAAGQIERKLVHESAANAAEVIARGGWPLDSNALMTEVGQLLGAEAAVGPTDRREVRYSSLDGDRRAELARQLSQRPLPARVTLAGEGYRLGTATVRRVSPLLQAQHRRLYLLVPERRVEAAKRQVASNIAVFTLAAVVVATVVGFWLSTSIARPVRRLADRMDRLARGAAEPTTPPRDEARPPGPSELARLTRSFDGLLGRLEEARRQLDRSARLATLGQLAAAVAHELRNPLSGIKMNARILADELAQAGKADRSLELIIREIDRMDLYLEELLGLAAAPGRQEESAEPAGPVRLDELADSVAALLEGRCEHAGVTVRRRYGDAVPAGRADGGKVRQVLLNLMLNALEAMPHGGTMTLATSRGDGGRVRLSVGDTGGGLSVPEGADVFEPFVTTKPQGTGLGLYVCRRLVEAAGGRVGCESSPDGCTFWFELPAAGPAE